METRVDEIAELTLGQCQVQVGTGLESIGADDFFVIHLLDLGMDLSRGEDGEEDKSAQHPPWCAHRSLRGSVEYE